MAIKTGSDFSGVGAFDQALSRLGIEQDKLFACDMDKYARQTYVYNYGEPKYYPENVYDREIPSDSLDIYMTSPPCQSFSLAGKRKGEDSKNGVLFYNSHEFIRKNNPRYFIFENVKGLLSDDGGKTFQRWIDYLGGKTVNGNPVIFPHEEATPYHVYYQVMNAKHYGVPQNRERIFIIGIRDDADNEFSFPKPFHLVKRLKDILEIKVDEKYFLSDKMIESITYGNKPNGEIANLNKGGERGSVYSEETDAISCLSATDYKQPKQIQIGTWRTHEDGRGFRATEDNNCPTIPARAREDGSGQPVIKVIAFGRSEEEKKRRKKVYQETGKDTGSFKDKNLILKDQEYYDTILASPNPQKEGLIMVPTNNSKGFDIAEEEEDSINFSNPNSETRRGRVGHGVSQTLDTACNQGILTQQRIRRLTPFECFRLMDFNENFKWNVSDSQAYKQAGNSIVVNCLVEIISKLKL
jgi:DNA (cytosine-5)-methyltransferase 1